MIKVAVTGAKGRMGKEVIEAVLADSETTLSNAIDKFQVGDVVFENIKIEDDIEKSFSLNKPDVVVDFTQPSVIFENIKIYQKLGVKSVIGTTGLKSAQIEEIKAMSEKNSVGCFIAPNFSTGAVLMMEFAKLAAKYFDNAEIIEYHHNQKKDAPSGTAIKTAELMAEVKNNFKGGNVDEIETIEGSRGGNFKAAEIQIHSVRMPGFMASQEVLFGGLGQTLSIRHDSHDRKCYMSGVLMAVKHVYKENNFVYGLENIL